MRYKFILYYQDDTRRYSIVSELYKSYSLTKEHMMAFYENPLFVAYQLIQADVRFVPYVEMIFEEDVK